jgi:tRNA nucleotidyltransferase/poly(A) polymerase
MSEISSGDRTAVVLAWPDILYDLQDCLSDFPQAVYIVGGAVRDAYLRRPIKDLDLATPGSGIRLARTIANAFKGDFYPLDAERDVGRAILNTPDGRFIIDAARLRGGTLEADLSDRDFTMNAMAVDLRSDLNAIIDPLHGLADLRAHLLRPCTDSSLETDPIRSLRAVRQSIQFGLRLDAQTLAAIRNTRDRLTSVSPERVRDEVFKLLDLARPVAALRILGALDLLPDLLPSSDERDFIFRLIDHLGAIWNVISPQRDDNTVAQFAYGMLAIQLGGVRARLIELLARSYGAERSQRALLTLEALFIRRDVCDEWSDRLRLSNQEKDRICKAVQAFQQAVNFETEPLSIYRYWRDAGDAGVDGLLLALAASLASTAQIDQDRWLRQIDRARLILEAYLLHREQAVDPPALVDGTVLMQQFGLRPGPIIRTLLEHIREGQVIGTIRTVEDALEAARRYLQTQADLSR